MKTLIFYIAAATLLFSANAKAQGSLSVTGKHTDATPTGTTIAAPAGLHLKFEQDSVIYDEIGIYYNAGWSDKYDDNDSYDLDGLNPRVYLSSFTSDGVRVSINAWDSYTTPSRIKLYVRATSSGSFTLSIEDFVNIDTSLYNINLIDNEQKDSINMAKFGTYTFNLSVADTAGFDNRFVLAVEPKNVIPVKPPSPYQLVMFQGEKVSQGVELDWNTLNAGTNKTNFVLQKLNTTNGYDSLYTIQSDSATNYTYIDEHPVIGNNVYRLKQVNAQTTYSSPITIGYGSVTPTNALNVYPNPSKSTINVKLSTSTTVGATYFADIYNMSGSLVKHQSVTSGSFSQDISSYKYGAYFIQLKDANGYVIGQSKFVKGDQ